MERPAGFWLAGRALASGFIAWAILDGELLFSHFCARDRGAVIGSVACLVERQNPGDGGFEVVVADFVSRVGQHWDFAPVAAATIAHLVEKLGWRFGIAFVFAGNVLVGRADAFLVDGVAGDAAGFLDDGFAGFGRLRLVAASSAKSRVVSCDSLD